MNDALKERLNKILDRITSPEFLSNSQSGGDIAFYIFDYPPEYELKIREHLDFVVEKASKRKQGLKILNINLFESLLKYIKERGYLDKVINLQKEKGNEAVLKALKGLLHQGQVANYLMTSHKPEEYDLVIISGIGNSWPMIRTHNLLNALQPLIPAIPLIVFYPGYYDGQTLSLFGKLKNSEEPYYRAFRLVV